MEFLADEFGLDEILAEISLNKFAEEFNNFTPNFHWQNSNSSPNVTAIYLSKATVNTNEIFLG